MSTNNPPQLNEINDLLALVTGAFHTIALLRIELGALKVQLAQGANPSQAQMQEAVDEAYDWVSALTFRPPEHPIRIALEGLRAASRKNIQAVTIPLPTNDGKPGN